MLLNLISMACNFIYMYSITIQISFYEFCLIAGEIIHDHEFFILFIFFFGLNIHICEVILGLVESKV